MRDFVISPFYHFSKEDFFVCLRFLFHHLLATVALERCMLHCNMPCNLTIDKAPTVVQKIKFVNVTYEDFDENGLAMLLMQRRRGNLNNLLLMTQRNQREFTFIGTKNKNTSW